MCSIYILMRRLEATDAEMVFSFFFLRWGTTTQRDVSQEPAARNGPLLSTLSLHCPPWERRERALNDERHQNQYLGLIPAALLLRSCTLFPFYWCHCRYQKGQPRGTARRCTSHDGGTQLKKIFFFQFEFLRRDCFSKEASCLEVLEEAPLSEDRKWMI